MRGGRTLMLTIPLWLFSSLTWAQVSTLSLAPSDDLIEPAEMNNVIDVEVFIDDTTELVAFQITLEVTGGDTGSLDLVNLFIDEAHVDPDYVFAGPGFSSISAVFFPGAEMFGFMMSPSWVTVAGPAYLGTFQLEPSADAVGVFNIRLVADTNHTFLLVDDGLHVFPNLDNSTLIGVLVDCIIDAGCDDGNKCTDDTCNAGVCDFDLVAKGTPCDDGQFCTEPDTCNNGDCIGGPNDPCEENEICSEFMDICILEVGWSGS